jgi:hypothetical protein
MRPPPAAEELWNQLVKLYCKLHLKLMDYDFKIF